MSCNMAKPQSGQEGAHAPSSNVVEGRWLGASISQMARLNSEKEILIFSLTYYLLKRFISPPVCYVLGNKLLV